MTMDGNIKAIEEFVETMQRLHSGFVDERQSRSTRDRIMSSAPGLIRGIVRSIGLWPSAEDRRKQMKAAWESFYMAVDFEQAIEDGILDTLVDCVELAEEFDYWQGIFLGKAFEVSARLSNGSSFAEIQNKVINALTLQNASYCFARIFGTDGLGLGSAVSDAPWLAVDRCVHMLGMAESRLEPSSVGPVQKEIRKLQRELAAVVEHRNDHIRFGATKEPAVAEHLMKAYYLLNFAKTRVDLEYFEAENYADGSFLTRRNGWNLTVVDSSPRTISTALEISRSIVANGDSDLREIGLEIARTLTGAEYDLDTRIKAATTLKHMYFSLDDMTGAMEAADQVAKLRADSDRGTGR